MGAIPTRNSRETFSLAEAPSRTGQAGVEESHPGLGQEGAAGTGLGLGAPWRAEMPCWAQSPCPITHRVGNTSLGSAEMPRPAQATRG